MESKVLRRLSVLSLAMGLASQVAQAEVKLDPQGIDLEPYRLIPTLGVDMRYDDNIYSLHDGAVGSFVTTVSPSAALVAQDRDNVYSLQYGLKAGFYAADTKNDYFDNSLAVRAHVEPTGRFRADLGAGYSLLHDDLGTGYTLGLGLPAIKAEDGVDTYKLANLHAGADYGADDAAGHIVFSGDINQKRYDRSFVADVRDYNELATTLGFHLRVMPKTNVLVDYERDDVNYKGNITPDTVNNRYLLGVSWENSAQTTGRFRLGQEHRSVQNSAAVNGFTWDAGVVWKPLQYSQFTLDGGQRSGEGVAPVATVRSQNIVVGWDHDWSERVSSRLSTRYEKDDNLLSDGTMQRTDTIYDISFNVNYQMRRWLVLGAGISDLDHSSSLSQFDYTRHVFSINAQASL